MLEIFVVAFFQRRMFEINIWRRRFLWKRVTVEKQKTGLEGIFSSKFLRLPFSKEENLKTRIGEPCPEKRDTGNKLNA